MKKYTKLSFFAAVALVLVGLASCSHKEMDTDQLSGPIALAAVSPNPVVRGAELHLFGHNLDKAVEVRIPGVDPIRDFTMGEGKGRLSEIVLTVPLEGPEVGKIVVADADGHTSSSHFDLTYTEGMVFSGFTCNDEVMPGDVITLQGEYLYNVKEVIFPSGDGITYATGAMIFDKTRHSTKVYVPAAATSGIIKICDVDEAADPNSIPNIFPSTKTITVGKPTVDVTEFPEPVKAGTVLTFTGNYLNMIAKVSFSGVEQKEFKVSDDATELTAALPAKASDGDVVFTTFAGDTFVAGTLEGVLPSGLTISVDEESDDPRYKAGYRTFITGEDLDLVTGVAFGGVAAKFEYDAEAVPACVMAIIPEEAPDGDVLVTLANGSEVVVDQLEFVNPAVEEVSATSIVAREKFQFTGKDLELIRKVSVGGIECSFALDTLDVYDDVNEEGEPIKVAVLDSTKVIVTTEPTILSGDVVIEKLNGWNAVISQMEVSYDEAVTLELPATVQLGQVFKASGENLFMIEQIYIKNKKVLNWVSRTDTEIVFQIPEGIGPGVYHLDLKLNNGESLTWAIPFEVVAPYTEKFIWEGRHDLAGWSANLEITPNGFRDVNLKEGDIVRIYYSTYGEGWWMFKVQDGSWGPVDLKIPGNSEINAITINNAPSGDQFFPIEVTAELAAQLLAPEEKAMAINGDGAYITGVSVIQFGATENKTVIWEGEHTIDWGGSLGEDHKALTTLSWGGYDWSTVSAGTVLRVEYTILGAPEAQLRIANGSWAALPGTEPEKYIITKTPFELELTQAMIDELVSAGGMVITGQGVTLTEVALVETAVVPPVGTTIWEGEYTIDWGGSLGDDNKALTALSWGGYDWSSVEAGTILRVEFTILGEPEAQLRIANGSWAALPGTEPEKYIITEAPFELELTQAMIDELVSAGGMVITGQGVTLTAVILK